MMVMPRCLSLSSKSKRCSLSRTDSELVGSSMTMICAPVPTAPAICTICSCAVDSSPMGTSTSMSDFDFVEHGAGLLAQAATVEPAGGGRQLRRDKDSPRR